MGLGFRDLGFRVGVLGFRIHQHPNLYKISSIKDDRGATWGWFGVQGLGLGVFRVLGFRVQGLIV